MASHQDMWFVYVIKSSSYNYKYVGLTNNLKGRLQAHNDGICKASKAYRPFELIAYFAVLTRDKAVQLEKYFKSGSGAAFLEKRVL